MALEQVYKHVIKAIRRPSKLKLQFIYTFYYDFVVFADTMSSYVMDMYLVGFWR